MSPSLSLAAGLLFTILALILLDLLHYIKRKAAVEKVLAETGLQVGQYWETPVSNYEVLFIVDGRVTVARTSNIIGPPACERQTLPIERFISIIRMSGKLVGTEADA